MATENEQERIRLAAFNITSGFEGGLGYANYQTYDAGIISYGRFQFTLAAGSLARVVNNYLDHSPSSPNAAGLRNFQARINDRDPALREDQELRRLLIAAAAEKDMQDAQDAIVIKSYWTPSQQSASVRGLGRALTQALFFDTAIQSGPGHSLIQQAEQELGVPPKSKVGENGLTEEMLVRQVALARQGFLSRLAARLKLPGVKRRGDFWVDLVEKADWNLQGDADGNVLVLGAARQVRVPPGYSTTPIEEPTPERPAEPAPVLPGVPVSGTLLTTVMLDVRVAPNLSSQVVGKLREKRRVRIVRRYQPSSAEEWLQLEDGRWVARRLPSAPGVVYGTLLSG
ncbi:MAG: chitosanase [Anaerolineae bacterium]|nr:chitosanase [Anaerolineae bacterium]